MVLAGCASLAPYTPTRQATLSLRPVEWNPTAAEVRQIASVGDVGDLALFAGAGGTTVIKSGAVTIVARDRAFGAVAEIAAADGEGRWLVGIDERGRLWRLRGATTFEEIGARYGLAGTPVRSLCSAGLSTVFRLDRELAVADGRTVARYPISLDDLACGPGRVVGRSGKKVVALELAHRTVRSFAVASIGAAVDGRGRVVVATRSALYLENAGGLALRYLAEHELRALVSGGGRVWFADGPLLAALDGDELAVTHTSLLSPRARLVGSSSGDVWALDPSVPPLRFTRDPGDGSTQRWATLVEPVFARLCAECHLAGGRSGVDLSTENAWIAERKELRERVIDKRSMPPLGYPLADADRALIQSWLKQ